jgi:hypothetical protein
MWQRHAFRPQVHDRLEDRLVLSTAKPTVHAHAPLSPQALAEDRVGTQYNDFVTNFTNAVNDDLYAPTVQGYGYDTPLFSQQLGQSLTMLTEGVVKAIGAPAGTPAVTQIRQQINGSAKTSLRSRLSALTLNSLEIGAAMSSYEGTAVKDIHQSYLQVKKQVAALTAATPTFTTSPATTSTGTSASGTGTST